MVRKSIIILYLFLGCLVCHAQTYDGSINNFLAAADKYRAAHGAEKLYMQTDRTSYAPGDTVWFRAYLFDAAFLHKSTKSNVVYVELSDEQGVVQSRRVVMLSNGLGHGAIPLLKRDFPDGGYTLRAYTNWQRNFDESGIFKKQLYVGMPGADRWLVHAGTVIKDNAAQLHLQLTDRNNKPIAGQSLLVGVRQDDAILRRDKPQETDANGGIDLAVRVRESRSPVYATLQKTRIQPGGGFAGLSTSVELDKHALLYKFPIYYNRPEKTDIQFMPEGGYLVAGISSVVGFKAIGEDGKGANISGRIVNAANNAVITGFASIYKGMGSFSFTPKTGETYKALIDLPDGSKKEFPMPQVKSGGTSMSVVNLPQSDSVKVTLIATNDITGRFTLLGQSRGMICYAAKTAFNNNRHSQSFTIAKTIFATGIAKLSLLNESLQTINERLIYINNKDNLEITVTPHKPSYTPQDSVALTIEVKNKEGRPVQGAFSMSVINSLADAPNADNPSILSYTLLASDLKGHIETPDYYLKPGHEKELDNLLLTQGWTAYDWRQIFQPDKPFAFAPEQDISISGTVSSLFKKEVKGAHINLLSLKPFFTMDTTTNENGRFVFSGFPQTDSAMFVRAKNNSGNASTYVLDLDLFQRPEFSANIVQKPWYLNTDTLRLKLNEALVKNEEQQEKAAGLGKTLKEVEIKEKKVIPGSHNLNGPGEADQVIDAHDIAKEKPMTLLELLKLKVKGFRTEGLGDNTTYYIGLEPIHFLPTPSFRISNPAGGFVIDGTLLDKKRNSKADVYNLLNYYTSDDILGIEVMSTAQTSKYELSYLTPNEKMQIKFPVPFIEITTREGKGPYIRKQYAGVVYKPVLSASAKDFYRPRYTVKNPAEAAFDNRVTIHWEPNIVTDQNGKATVSFYAAGQPATYAIITEGSDMASGFGSVTKNLNIK